MAKRDTITTEEMLELCQYRLAGKSKGAIRKLALHVRRKYHIDPIKTAPKGFLYDAKEVERKVPFIQLVTP